MMFKVIFILLTGYFVAHASEAILSKSIMKNNIVVYYKLIPAENNSLCCEKTGWLGWGEERKCPDTSIGSLEVSYETDYIYIPLSAFVDLGNPKEIEIHNIQNKISDFNIQIIGGDASTSYKAVLKFSNNALIARSVHHGEFSDDVWEETSYHFKE